MSAAAATSAPATDIDAEDRDSLHTLSLSLIPVAHPAIKRARIIKNTRLESVIEVFKDREAGSGQIDIEKIPGEFGWPASPPHPDFVLLRKLELMPSYDVYSLRVALRAHGIAVNETALKLSPDKTRELARYMKSFTRPLLLQIYGGEAEGIETLEDVVAMFRDPDIERARKKLLMMAAKLGLNIQDIPRFLEDYADIFLSLSYYRQCLDRIAPIVEDFLDSMKDLRKSYQMRTNQQLMLTCDEMEKNFTELLTSVTGRLEAFNRHTKDMWDNLSAEKFRKIERIIKAYHITMGGILCALTVKMDAWAGMFPKRNMGGPVRRADFIMTDIKHGLKRIRDLERKAPSMAELN
ncbi:MAG: hypothetical protein AB7I36_05185 [Rhodospirillaceae bacterium]